jgi:glutathione S-transferase
MTVHESGAILDYIVRRHGGGRLQPDPATAAYDDYVQWLHYAEGSAMLPLMLRLYTARLGEAAAQLRPRIDSEMDNHMGFIDAALAGRDWLLDTFSAADVQLSMVGEVAAGQGRAFPNIDAWVARFQARPAYRRAIEKGGAYNLDRAAS